MPYEIRMSKSSPSHYLCEVTNGVDTYYIKFAQTSVHLGRLNELLKIDLTQLKTDQKYELSPDLMKTTFEDLISEFIEITEKEVIQLSKASSRSIEDKAVLCTYRILNKYKNYWEGHTPFELFSVLSEDIIEMPYVDDPNDSVYKFGQTAFHTNHGTNHAVRQYILSKNYLDFLKREAIPDIKEAANELTLEEKSCLDLANFLFRSGRTNERGWGDDNTYGVRSAEIFRQIATDLGYNKTLIDLLAQSYDYHGSLIISSELPGQNKKLTEQKALLFRKLLELSHESDLVRCEIDTDKTQEKVKTVLAEVLPKSYDTTETVNSFLDFAATLCRETGSKIDSQKLQRKNSNDMRGNSNLEVSTTHNVAKTCMKLNALRTSIYPPSISPTKRWLESEEHIYIEGSRIRIWGRDKEGNKIIPELGWADEQINAIPTEACVQSEEEHTEHYVSVYHATTKSSRALELLCKALASPQEDDITWHRTSLQRTGTTYTDIEVMKSKSLTEVDNSALMQWHLLSCNPTLWHNSDFDSQESTVDYFLKNSSVTAFDFSELINDLLDQRKLLVGQNDKRRVLVEKFHTLVKNPKFGEQGILYQYQIPHHLVDEVAYISKKNGKLDTDNPSALDTLYAMKTPGMPVPNQDTLQVRLLVPKLMEQDIARQLKVSTHSRMSTELELEFSQIINDIAQDALTGPSDVVVEKTQTKKTFTGFGALESFSRSREIMFQPSVTTTVTAEATVTATVTVTTTATQFDSDDDIFNPNFTLTV